MWRMTSRDPFNLCLNYAYGVMEGHVRKAINIVGLKPAVGFLHESSGSQTKESLVYDLQEPFRRLGDVATIEAFESAILDMKDFHFTGDDYRYNIEIDAKRWFLELLKNRFNSGVRYKGKTWKWDTIILAKAQDLARYLLDKLSSPCFVVPAPRLERVDSQEFRERILALSAKEAKRFGINRDTLRYLRKKADDEFQFKVYAFLRNRLGL